MAFATKYTSVFTTLVGPSRIKTDYTIYFKKEGYNGLVISLTAASLKSKILNTDDSILGIKEKKINLDFITSLDLSDLQLTKPKEWQVVITRTVNFTIYDDFIGYLIPTDNQSDYVDGKKLIRLEATDGLGVLKNIDFVDNSLVYYEGFSSVFEVIRLCLLKIGTGLKINTINNTFGSTHTKTDSAEALKQRFIDVDLFRGSNEPLDTYKVLSQIIITENCRIYQQDGEWWIENVSEKGNDGQVKSRKYLNDGSQNSYGNLDLRISAIHGNSSYQPMAGGTVSTNNSKKWVKIEHKLAGFKNQLLNRDFRIWSGTEFENWVKNDIDVVRVGDGTSGNLFGVKIGGYAASNSAASSKSILQSIILGTSANSNINQALNFNVVFSGEAFTQDIDHALIKCRLIISVEAFSYNAGNYPSSVTSFGLNDNGEWVLGGTSVELENKDVNKHSKKTGKTWNIVSNRIGDLGIRVGKSTIIKNAWTEHATSIVLEVILKQGVGQLEPYPGETQNSNVWYKNISLGWINADTNLNLKQISYRAVNPDYSPNNETFEAIYGDYSDGANLSALKNADGSVTSLWVSKNESAPRNFHNLGVADLLNNVRVTQKVYDGSIWGLVKYSHSLAMNGFVRRGYIVAWEYDYYSSFTTVRVIEHQANISVESEKKGILSDGTEIFLIGEELPSPHIGHGGGGTAIIPTIDYADNWIKQVIGGIQGRNPSDDAVNVFWNYITAGDSFDFGAMVRQGEQLKIAKDDTFIDIGNEGSLTKITGQFSLGDNLFTDISQPDSGYPKRLYLDTNEMIIDGDFVANKLSLPNSNLSIESILDEYTKIASPYVKTIDLPLYFDVPSANFLGNIGATTINSINSSPIVSTSEWNFSNLITVQTPIYQNNPVTKQYFENAISVLSVGGFNWYGEITVATTENITLYGHQTVDNVSCGSIGEVGTTVLVKDQTNRAENGIYYCQLTNWVRISDFNSQAEIYNKIVSVTNGTVNNGSQWLCRVTPITIGVTQLIFECYSRNYTNPYLAHTNDNGFEQIFYGQNAFKGILTVPNPLIGGSATTKVYVDTLIANITSTITGLGSSYWGRLASGAGGVYIPSVFGNAIGTTNNDALSIVVNGIKQAQFSAGRALSGLKYIGISDGDFSSRPFSSYENIYGLFVRNNVYLGASSGSNLATYMLDMAHAGNTNSKFIMRFGGYLAVGGLPLFYRGIEYDKNNYIKIGYYAPGTTTLDSNKIITLDPNGNIGVGNETPAEKVDISGNLKYSGTLKPLGIAPSASGMFLKSLITESVVTNIWENLTIADIKTIGADHTFIKSNGTSLEWSTMTVGEIADIATTYQAIITGTSGKITKFTGTHTVGNSIITETTGQIEVDGSLNVKGKYYLNGSFGADHTFLKSNGTGQEWSPMTVGEITDIAANYLSISAANDFVRYETVDEERGICFYSDAENTIREGQIVTGQDTGIALAIYANKMIDNDTSNIVQFGIQLDRNDCKLYHYNNGTRERILTTADSLGTGGGTGITYSAQSPITIQSSVIGITQASTTTSGYLSALDWTTFNNKINDGGTVNQFLNFANGKAIYFDRVSNSEYGGRIYSNNANSSWNFQTDTLNMYFATYGVEKNLEFIANDGDLKFSGKKYIFQKNNSSTHFEIEIDMSGFAIGKVLKATSNIKAEWVTL